MNCPLKKSLYLTILLLFTAVFLSACGKKPSLQEPVSITETRLGVPLTITLYDSEDKNLLLQCMSLCDQYEKIFSRTDESSELSRLNNGKFSDSNGVSQISPRLAGLLGQALYYSRLTDGAFDLTLAPVSSLWDLAFEEKQIPRKTDILGSLSHVNYRTVTLEQNQVQAKDPSVQFDLDLPARGYISDRIKDYLQNQGIKSGKIDFGGDLLYIGNQPDGTPFSAEVPKPFGEPGEVLVCARVSDLAVSICGTYEKYFRKEETLYHSILDPATGYPCQSGLSAVAVFTSSSADSTVLAAAFLVLGLEKGKALAESLVPPADAIFITDKNEVYYTTDFHKHISV